MTADHHHRSWGAASARDRARTRQPTGDPESQSEDGVPVKPRVQKPNRPPGHEPIRGVAPARACAYAVVRRVFEQGAWADRALHGEARRLKLDPRDLGLATQLSFGTVQRVATLDHVIAELARRPVAELDPPLLA